MLSSAAPRNLEQRSDPRIPISVPARISVGGAPPVDCSVVDLSLGGAGIRYEGQAAPMADAVARLQIQGFGIFDGITVRDAGDLRGLRFVQGEAERHRLLDKLTAFIEEGLNDPTSGLAESRSTLSLHRANGRQEQCEVLCITFQGVVLSTTQRPTLGEMVRVGRLYGRVVRYFLEGVGVEFISFVNPVQASRQA
jgi:hypothetical protein